VSVGIGCGSIRGRRRVVEVGGLLYVSVCLHVVGLILRTYPERRQRARVGHIVLSPVKKTRGSAVVEQCCM
jgi:hypothetical protein